LEPEARLATPLEAYSRSQPGYGAEALHLLGEVASIPTKQAQERLTTATTMYREMGMTDWLEKAEGEPGESP
jgi:hypothetical protein